MKYHNTLFLLDEQQLGNDKRTKIEMNKDLNACP